MNIIIDNKEIFINANNISTVSPINVDAEDPTNNTYEIKMNNGDRYQLEYFSFMYFRNYSSAEYASFSLNNYLRVLGAKEEFLKRNKILSGS